jgi:hypothetical protein
VKVAGPSSAARVFAGDFAGSRKGRAPVSGRTLSRRKSRRNRRGDCPNQSAQCSASNRYFGQFGTAKFWLNPLALVVNFGFPARELRTIEAIVRGNQQKLIEAWNDYFGT